MATSAGFEPATPTYERLALSIELRGPTANTEELALLGVIFSIYSAPLDIRQLIQRLADQIGQRLGIDRPRGVLCGLEVVADLCQVRIAIVWHAFLPPPILHKNRQHERQNQ